MNKDNKVYHLKDKNKSNFRENQISNNPKINLNI